MYLPQALNAFVISFASGDCLACLFDIVLFQPEFLNLHIATIRLTISLLHFLFKVKKNIYIQKYPLRY